MFCFHPIKLRQNASFLLALIFGVVGCISGQNTATNVLTETTITNTTITVEAEQRNNSISSLTPIPFATAVARPTNTLIPATDTTEDQNGDTDGVDQELPPNTPTSTSTITPVPTLNPDEEGSFLSSLMTSNRGCKLPCWWGVTPGETSEQAAREMFSSQGIDEWELSDDYRVVGIGYPRAENSDYSRDVIIRFWVENGLIQYIGVVGSYRRELNPLLVQDWQAYSPTEILNRYGTPSYIEFTKVENSPYYRLGLSYEFLGIELSYVIPFESLDTGQEKICFDLENVDFISSSLYSPEGKSNIPVDLIPNRLDSYISWEATTGLGIEAFQELFETNSNPPCVEVD